MEYSKMTQERRDRLMEDLSQIIRSILPRDAGYILMIVPQISDLPAHCRGDVSGPDIVEMLRDLADDMEEGENGPASEVQTEIIQGIGGPGGNGAFDPEQN